MEHNGAHLNAPLHWGYAVAPSMPTTPQNSWVSPQQSHGLKRTLSESDCEELYSEESSKDHTPPSEPGSCQLMSRKKRRGVIEKKRRDRINSSLSELKRLVPSAYEKQGSAKLEKAEILQLTVEHLKNLHSKGMDSLTYDPQRFAMEYHIIGFRECAAEVARYLVTIEGMDLQDPLRLRLMSHLQYFAQQREMSAKGCGPPPNNWATTACASTYQSNCAVSPYQPYATSATAHPGMATAYVPTQPPTMQPYPALSSSPNTPNMHVNRSSSSTRTSPNETIGIADPTNAQRVQQTSQHQSQNQISHEQQTPTTHETHHQQRQHYTQEHVQQDHQGTTYIELTSTSAHPTHRNTTPTVTTGELHYAAPPQYPASGAQEYGPNTGLNYVPGNGAKPYRPWGAEMAY